MIDFQEFCAENPLRPPDWRYRAAADCVARGLPPPRSRWDGLTIQTALSLERRRDAGRAIQRPHHSGVFQKTLDIAQGIFLDRNRTLRYTLEAWILADMPVDKITDLRGMSPLVVELYEAACYDVRDRLDHREDITCCVINSQAEGTCPSAPRALPPCGVTTAGKLFFEAGGGVLMDPARRKPAGSADRCRRLGARHARLREWIPAISDGSIVTTLRLPAGPPRSAVP
jgi:hypothetical protein